MSQSQKLVPYVHTDGEVWKHFFVDVKSQIIQYEAKINGKRIKFSTKEKFPNGVKAKRFANSELDRRLGRKKTVVRTLIKEELKLYKKMKESENLKYDTMNNIYRAINDIEEFWGNKLPSEINNDLIGEWFDWWRANKGSLQMENVIKYMRNFCKYLSQKVVGGFPMLPAIPRISDPRKKEIRAARKKKKENIFTAEEFKAIYNAAGSLENRVLCLMMYTMATRVTETLEMCFDSEIYLDGGSEIYRWRTDQNKAGLDGFHSLHPRLVPLLRTLRTKRIEEGTKRLFPQKFNIQAPLKSQQVDWVDWEKKAGLGWHWTAHTFRHTCLSNLFNNHNNPQLLICKLYRISYKEAEETYVKPTVDGREKMRTTLEVVL